MDAILNFLHISDALGTAGQPTAEQFSDVRAAGYQVVINLALPTSTNALPNEQEWVTGQGMEYVHIPVVWEAPTAQGLERFFEAMEQHAGKKVLVHCALNYRASAFVLLYRVLRLGAPPEAAWTSLRQIWEPDETWQSFINQALAQGA